jgi:hypothetical protein
MNNELIDGINTAEQNEIAFLVPLAIQWRSRVDALKKGIADHADNIVGTAIQRAKLFECESILYELEDRLQTFEGDHKKFIDDLVANMHEFDIDE